MAKVTDTVNSGRMGKCQHKNVRLQVNVELAREDSAECLSQTVEWSYYLGQ
jgi:hypothetical protein